MKEWIIALVPLVSAAAGVFLAYKFTSRVKRDLLRKSKLDYAAFEYVDVYETKTE